jgi:hypothetical protein
MIDGAGASVLPPLWKLNLPDMRDLHVSAQGLRKANGSTPSSAACCLDLAAQRRWEEWGRTEAVRRTASPSWVRSFRVQVTLGSQRVRLRVVDEPDETVGFAEFDLSLILRNPAPTTCDLKRGDDRDACGRLTITHDAVPEALSVAVGRVTGVGFGSLGVLGRAWYYEIAKESAPGEWRSVYRSQPRGKDMDWEPFQIPYHMLCSCEPTMPLRLTVFKSCRVGSDEQIASLIGSFDQWRALAGPAPVKGGALKFEDFSFRSVPSFYSFLKDGTININLIVAIDFTESNRRADDPLSLHYNGDPQKPSPYEVCIRAVGDVLCQYDEDQRFPVFGFGALYDQAIQHCFPLTFDDDADAVEGIQGIIDAYRYALQNIEFGNTTRFSRVIAKATGRARQAYERRNTYTILLIITDGALEGDLQDSIDAIVEANDAPLSIIIVGVGSENFDAMKKLDASKSRLIAKSKQEATRSIVHFVPFAKFQADSVRLANEVVTEVPTQVERWVEMNGQRG